MRVVDTSAWIEWLTGGPLKKTLQKEFPDKAQCVVPTIVQLELAKWLAREVGEDQADQVIAFTQKCIVAPLDTRIALSAADLHRRPRPVPGLPSRARACDDPDRSAIRAEASA